MTVFTGEVSRRGYRLNKLGSSLTDPANRTRFLADEVGYMRALALDDAQIALVRARDWAGLIAAGGNIYLMLKLAGTVGQTLLKMGAQMRGETLEAFMATRPSAGKH
jgi:protocatechuate 4,5-dioxygenase alpha chain